MLEKLYNEGISKPIVQWLSTNITSTIDNNGIEVYKWKFNINVINQLFDDFCQTDLFPFLFEFSQNDIIKNSNNTNYGNIHFLRAGKNPSWTNDILESFSKLTQTSSHIQLHHMSHVGHWVHVEDLQVYMIYITFLHLIVFCYA
jgi:hypothetical protein